MMSRQLNRYRGSLPGGFLALITCLINDRLLTLGLPTLELRRLRADLLLCYKILSNLIPVKPENYGLKLSNTITRGHNKKLQLDHSGVGARRNYFGVRVVKPWNSLSNELVNAPSVACFKRDILNYNLNNFLKLDND